MSQGQRREIISFPHSPPQGIDPWNFWCQVRPQLSSFVTGTVKPVLSSTILRGHPVLSGWLSKSQIFSLKNCNFHSYSMSWSPYTESLRHVCIVFHLHWIVTYSRTTHYIKLRIISYVKCIPCVSPRINVSTMS